MKPKKKKKNGLKYAVLVTLFLVIVGVATFIALGHTKQEEKEYSSMAGATLPLLTVSYLEDYETELHGYVNEMNLTDMRDVIVPLSDKKSLDVQIQAFDNPIDNLEYEIRSLNNEEFLDSETVSLIENNENVYSTTLEFSELLTSGKEYQLVIKLFSGSKTIYYYTRVIYGKNMYTKELLEFVREFSDATYDREKAATFLVNYIQPDQESDTTDYHYTDIHSKYGMFTYGNLNVTREKGTLIRITELPGSQISVTLSYQIRIAINDEWKNFWVDEFFCARYRSEKVYLLDYHRTLEEDFDVNVCTRENGRILLGVSDGKNQVMSSENNEFTVFVKQHQIWEYNAVSNAMTLVFGFKDEKDLSNRSSYDHYETQIVKVTDEGDIDYMVYGYMNRGIYEGQVGLCFYRYEAEDNATKRLFYMPVTQSEQVLMMDIGSFAYVNQEDVCYLRYGDGIYSIDLNSGESVEVTIQAYPGMYAKNSKGNVVAWVEGDNLDYPERLIILNMDSQTTIVVNAEEGQYVKILDFIGDDIVYGFGWKEDSLIQANVDTQQLLNRVLIASTGEKLEIQKEYVADGFYILSAEVFQNRITIQRGIKRDDNTLERIEDEVLLLTQEVTKDTEKSMLMSRNNTDKKTEYYIQVGNFTNPDSEFSTSVSRFEIQESEKVIALTHQQENVFKVYGNGKLLGVESKINKAISEAFDIFGVVTDERMNYVWSRGTRDLFKVISIQPYRAESKENSLGAALQVLCAQEGIQLKHVEEDLKKGMSPFEIINTALKKDRAMNLYGCTVSQIEYFLNQGHPVMAIMGNREAVVLSGYELTNVSVYFPATGETVKMENAEAEAYFNQNNNAFISYR